VIKEPLNEKWLAECETKKSQARRYWKQKRDFKRVHEHFRQTKLVTLQLRVIYILGELIVQSLAIQCAVKWVEVLDGQNLSIAIKE
jgi:hypothetical protein